MTRPVRFDNRHYDQTDQGRGRKRLIARIILILVIVALSIVAGAGLYSFRTPVHDTAAGIATTVREGIRTHFADGFSIGAVVPFLKDLFSGRDSPAPSPGDIGETKTNTSAAFLYTVELTDGGRIEGRQVEVGQDTVTISDDSGVKVQVDRDRVARISKMPL